MTQEYRCGVNPLMDTLKLEIIVQQYTLVHWPLMGGLSHLVQRGKG